MNLITYSVVVWMCCAVNTVFGLEWNIVCAWTYRSVYIIIAVMDGAAGCGGITPGHGLSSEVTARYRHVTAASPLNAYLCPPHRININNNCGTRYCNDRCLSGNNKQFLALITSGDIRDLFRTHTHTQSSVSMDAHVCACVSQCVCAGDKRSRDNPAEAADHSATWRPTNLLIERQDRGGYVAELILRCVFIYSAILADCGRAHY